MTEERCVVCGGLREDHHDFTPPKRASSGCVCEAGTWGNPTDIPPVCDKYEPMSVDGSYCATCEHDKACHAEVSR